MSVPQNVKNYYNYTPNSFQRYGASRDGGRRRHRGTDISHSTRSGTLVPALISGRVIGKLTPANWHGFGYQITTQGRGPDNREYRVSYAHGARAQTASGNVSQGQNISTEGTTGATTGPCCHIEVFDVARGVFIDPMILIRMVLASSGGSGGEVGRVTVNRSVKAIQKLVGATQDGTYGPDTTAKVKAWQKKNGLTPDGWWGPASDAKGFGGGGGGGSSSATLRRGSTGAAVGALQRKLKTNYPLYAGKLVVDNIFGPATEAAVREFQRRAGLKVDGLVGPATKARLGL